MFWRYSLAAPTRLSSVLAGREMGKLHARLDDALSRKLRHSLSDGGIPTVSRISGGCVAVLEKRDVLSAHSCSRARHWFQADLHLGLNLAKGEISAN